MSRWATVIGVQVAVALAMAGPAGAFRPPELSVRQEQDLRANFTLCVGKLKGPYTENFCVCRDGAKRPVRSADGRIGSPCGKDPLFCSAFRAPWAEALARERVYLGNIFSRDLYLWDDVPNHHDLVRGYVLEKHFTETNPTHKLAQLRAFGGLSGSEYETGASMRFFERYLAAPDFDDARHFLLAYELQRRFFVRDDLGQIEKVRAMAVRLQAARADFKPLRDAVHNQISAGLLPQLASYRDRLADGALRAQVDALIAEIARLTALDESALRPQVAALADAALRAQLTALVPAAGADPVDAAVALGDLMARCREAVAAKQVAPADARRLVDLDVTAAAVLQRRGSAVVEGGVARPVRQHVRLLGALTQAAYGAGLLLRRERDAALDAVHALEASPTPARRDAAAALARAERVVEWAQANATLAFAEVWAPWTFLLPQVASIGDDILRSSPLLLYAQVSRRLDDWAAGSGAIRHDLFGTAVGGDVRALNPGLALGRLRVAPRDGTYQRDEVVALPETPAELQPAAGILTQGEGNVLSHVQLLARSLGIPNVVVGPAPFRALRPHDGQRVLLLVTPGGRVVLEEASAMNAQERAVYEEYTRNEQRAADGSLGGGSAKLHIDRARIDVASAAPRDLAEVRRADSGRFCGPKAAYLGELKHLVPDKVARGVVVPFGAYYAHYQHATVAVPEALAKAGLARPGEPLPAFVERTYREFFDTLIPARTSERELSAWIAPRLEVIRHSIRRAPLAAELREGIRDQLARQGLLLPDDRSQTVGCFVRSDTNVEDLDTFNGAGLNLTVFNRRSLDDIYEGLKEVWASPFELRSFSWRQTLIDEPLWVLPSVVILESVPSEKSGVLVTADVTTGDPGKMLVATSEGVGGAVDGTPAETLLWSPQGVELVTLFKSPWRRVLEPGGGSTIVASSGRDVVLAPDELAALVAAAQRIGAALEPTRDAAGKARPWDIEFGFARGHLWLFQTRPFVGNDALKNVAALAALEPPRSADAGRLSLEDALR